MLCFMNLDQRKVNKKTGPRRLQRTSSPPWEFRPENKNNMAPSDFTASNMDLDLSDRSNTREIGPCSRAVECLEVY